jgi:hypothetical protein
LMRCVILQSSTSRNLMSLNKVGETMQKFYASPRNTFTWPDGAIGYRPGGPMDCLGPYAKVSHCAIDGTNLRRTCYATGYADSFFSIPACTRIRGRYIGGFFTHLADSESICFVPMAKYREKYPELFQEHQS